MIDNKRKHKLIVLSKELNDLLNALHESSKKIDKVTPKLVLHNTAVYLWRNIRTVKGLLTGLGISAGWIIAYTADAFHHLLNLPASSILVLSSIIILLSGALLRNLVLNEMSTVSSEMFHLGVYEKRNRREYLSLISMAKEKDFILTLREQLESELNEDIDKLKSELKKNKEVIEQKYDAINQKDDALNILIEELDRSEAAAIFFKEKSDFMIDILYQLKSKLNLLVNDQFNLDNIDFGSNYTLYKVEEKGLSIIGAYGINNAELDVFIPIERENNPYIRSLKKNQSNPFILTDFISWKRTLQDGSEWIMSLHLDDSNRDKLNMKIETGKLNVTITQEVLWICCELLNKFADENGGS
ncbi:hypothetical protein [Salipaludibacillus daqingensis]|uniref:hypothetical protein n=1 Tax=Salipaludibacillus daqingensis TaxID=3041001 RepID=UPI002476D27B|nr:hypothetical protein [Salipaludibacillus daqingensis]